MNEILMNETALEFVNKENICDGRPWSAHEHQAMN